MRAKSADFYEDEVDASIQALSSSSNPVSGEKLAHAVGELRGAGVRRMPDVGTGLTENRCQDRLGHSADRNDVRRLHELQHSSRELASGLDLRYVNAQPKSS